MPNLSLIKIVSLVTLSLFIGYFCFRFITSPEFILNMVGYVFSAITILTIGTYFIYKMLGDSSEESGGEIY